MDLKQLEYIVMIAEENSITRAAERLFITQSGLNQQLLKLEAELGIQLFHRSKNDFRLTQAGQVYVSYARKILRLKQEAYNILNDMAGNKRGTLRVGLTPERGIAMFMSIYPAFYAEYPHITIEPLEIGVREQLSRLTKGYLDLGIVTVTEKDRSSFEYIHLMSEDLVLAIPRSHPLAALAAAPGAPFTTVSLEDFKRDKFVLMTKGSTMRNLINPLFKEAGYVPDILFESASNHTLRSIVKRRLGCTILPAAYAGPDPDIAYFYLPSRPSWELDAVYKKGTYQMKAAGDFIKLAKDYWTSHPYLTDEP